MQKKINTCISQYFRCLSYCTEFSGGDIDTMQGCHEFCDANFFKGVGAVFGDVSQQIDSLAALRQALHDELTSPHPSRARVFDLLGQLSTQASRLNSLVRIREDLTRQPAGTAPVV